MSFGPVFGSVADRVNQYIAATDAKEFTARDIAKAIGDVRVNVVSAALSKLKSDKKITYRVVEHEKWGRPIHMYLNPRDAAAMTILDKLGGVQVPVVTSPHVVRIGRREIINPGCTMIVENWIEKKLTESTEEVRFTTTLVAKETGIGLNRVSALLNSLRYRHRIRLSEKDGCRNVYTTTKRMFHSYKPRRRRPEGVGPTVSYVPEVRKEPVKAHGRHGLMEYLLETAIKVEKSGPTREICLGLIETLCTYLRMIV